MINSYVLARLRTNTSLFAGIAAKGQHAQQRIDLWIGGLDEYKIPRHWNSFKFQHLDFFL